MKPHARVPAARRLFPALCLLALTAWGASPAAAQVRLVSASQNEASQLTRFVRPAAPVVPAVTLEEQLTGLLDYEVGNIRVQALQQIIFLSTVHGDEYDFSAAVPRILDFYENGEDEAFRIMALSALHAIGDAGAMRRLQARVADEPSKRVRLLTLAALKAYYDRQPA
jgi:hypothetical protein